MSDSPTLFERFARPFVNNEVRTDQEGWYPEIKPRTYVADPDAVLEALQSVIDARQRWTLTDVDQEAHELDFEVETPRMEFIDDVTVWLEIPRSDHTLVHARSRSRVGEGDFGQNARTIRELFERLDRTLEDDASRVRDA